ncbi:MAG: inner membrane-spanning protein YciB [Henriciella sp.]
MTGKQSGIGTAADKANQIWADLAPVVGFVLVYNGLRIADLQSPFLGSETALYWATGVLIAATFWTVSNYLRQGRPVPLFLVFTATIVGGFGLLGIFLQDKQFLLIKPTIQNGFLATMIFGSLAIKQNIWKVMFQSVFELPDFAWRTLAIRWGCFFIMMALWNEFLWRNYSEDVWANWKLGNMAITFVFGAINVPYMLKNLADEDRPDTDTPSA